MSPRQPIQLLHGAAAITADLPAWPPSSHRSRCPHPRCRRPFPQVLVALQRLVNALGPDSPATHPLVLPVLRLCCDPGHPDALNLLEDGLQLWLVALRNAPAPEPGLLALFPLLAAGMAASTEHIAVGMRICASCVLLGGAEFLRHYGEALVAVLVGFIGNVKDRGMLSLFPTMNAVVQVGRGGGRMVAEGWMGGRLREGGRGWMR